MTLRWGVLAAAVAQAQRLPRMSAADLMIAMAVADGPGTHQSTSGPPPHQDDEEQTRLTALVDLACQGDAEAFGQLYDHYVAGVFKFVYARVNSRTLAEDLTSEAFTRALRSIGKFQWQGKDFGAWLTTIARNLVADHFKSSRHRLELVTDELEESQDIDDSPEDEALASLTGELLLNAVRALPDEQRDCLLMRFVQGMSIAQTAQALGRSDGAIKQLQLRAVRRLARELPKEAVL